MKRNMGILTAVLCIKNIFDSIEKASTVEEAEAIAEKAGVDPSKIEEMEQDEIALYYLSHKTMYDNLEQLEKAISTSGRSRMLLRYRSGWCITMKEEHSYISQETALPQRK